MNKTNPYIFVNKSRDISIKIHIKEDLDNNENTVDKQRRVIYTDFNGIKHKEPKNDYLEF